jgi:cytochrome c oxidase subunit II
MRRPLLGLFAVTALAFAVAGTQPLNTSAAQTPEQVVEMTAKKYEFSPAQIHVKVGTHVVLKVTATDRTHGIQIDPVSEGTAKGAEPGLKFDTGSSDEKVKLPENQMQEIAFTALKAGAYDFHCSEFCGTGHRNMKGVIIVDP